MYRFDRLPGYKESDIRKIDGMLNGLNFHQKLPGMVMKENLFNPIPARLFYSSKVKGRGPDPLTISGTIQELAQ